MYVYDKEKNAMGEVNRKSFPVFSQIEVDFEKNVEIQQKLNALIDKWKRYLADIRQLTKDLESLRDEKEDLKCQRIPDDTYSGTFPAEVKERLDEISELIPAVEKSIEEKQKWAKEEYPTEKQRLREMSDWWEDAPWGMMYTGPGDQREVRK